jgi:hypothetical protein
MQQLGGVNFIIPSMKRCWKVASFGKSPGTIEFFRTVDDILEITFLIK